ncbi:MAG: hypothetical protein COA79_18405 [Planctomycetota bacterium]|nr:MAG: hypothetical protein COA79_18405 [Planctomycetota bacterium]
MSNIKRGMRYHNAEDDVIKFSYDGSDSIISAIIVNESFTGIGCVYVGEPLKPGQNIFWNESEKIKTKCEIIRCEELKEEVFFIAFEIIKN